MQKTKIKKAVNYSIKILIIILSYYILYKELFHNQDYKNAFNAFSNNILTIKSIILQAIILILMLVNWSVETIKWKHIIENIQKLSFYKALKSVLAGVAVSSVFPNRSGEFIGRVMVLEKNNYIKGSLSTFIGNTAQLIVTMVLGFIAFPIFLLLYTNLLERFDLYLIIIMFFIFLLLNVLIVFLYFKMNYINNLLKYLLKKRAIKILKYTQVFSSYNTNDLTYILFLSLIRYLIFSLQYYLCLKLFNVNINIFEGIILISTSYLLLTIIPTVALSEIGVRGSIAILIFGAYFGLQNLNEVIKLSLVAASCWLWVINIVIPAIIGSFIIIKAKL